jgi:hypothetical protein
MVDYQQAKIYKIVIGQEIYVGSTTKKWLRQRKQSHIGHSKWANLQNHPLYSLVNSLPTQWKGINLELIESYPCKSKDQLYAKEAEWIRKIGTLNSRIPGRTKEDYRTENREALLAKDRERNAQRKEAVSIMKKRYYEANKKDYLRKCQEYSATRLTCPHCNKDYRRDWIKQHIKRIHTDVV